MKPTACKPLALALGAAFAAGSATAFAATDLGRGYEVAAADATIPASQAATPAPMPPPPDAKAADGKAAANAGAKADAKVPAKGHKADAKSAEHSCGEGGCGAATPQR